MRLGHVTAWLLPVILAIVIAAGWYAYAGPGYDRAPAVTFSIIDGSRINLDDLRGRPVMVQFWATSCPSCRKEMPQLAALYNDLHGKGLELIAVAMPYDPPNRVLEMTAKKEFPYPVALDFKGEVTAAFGNVNLTPTSFLIGPDGNIVHKQIGEADFTALRQQILNMLSQQQQNDIYKS